MSDFIFCELAQRALLRISGDDRADFLQNIITNDIHKASTDEALYALLLTPQGKFLFDFFIIDDGAGGFLLDCQKSQRDALVKKLTLYRLRAQIEIEVKDDLKIWFMETKNKNDSDAIIFRDPRHPDLGWRIIAAHPPENITQTSIDHYTSRRIGLGICEAGSELTQERFPLECNLDSLHAIDFNKGCYIGQEVTSRMKRRADGGRKRMAVVIGSQPLPTPGEVILIEGKTVGHLLSAQGKQGLAIIRRDLLTAPTAQLDGQSAQIHFML